MPDPDAATPEPAPDPAYAGRGQLLRLVVLYGSQYVAAGFLLTLTAVLRYEGASLHQLGVVSLAGFATLAKVLWAPFLDRHGGRGRRGHYRAWLLVVQPLIALTLLSLVLVRPREDFPVLVAVAFLVSVLIGTQDIATDGLAVRITARHGRGTANAIQVGAGFGGAIVGSTGTLVVYQHAGWPWAVVLVAVLSVLPLAAVRGLREPDPDEPAPDEPGTSGAAGPPVRRPVLADVLALLRRPGVGLWMGLLVPLTWCGIILPQAVLAPMLVDRGWRPDQLGLLISVVTGVAGIAGAALAGRLVRRLGRRRTLVTAAVVQLVATGGLFLLAAGIGGPVPVAAVVVLGVARGVTNTTVFTISMDLSRTRTAGSDFTILSTWGYALAVVMTALGPVLAGAVGYPGVLAAGLALSAAALLCVYRFFTGHFAGPVASPVAGPAGAERPVRDAATG